jgi:putative SOS response-associated peptidase YedK
MSTTTTPNDPHFLVNWKPTEDICIILDDKTGNDRTPAEIDALFEAIRSAANNAGFDLSTWGLRPGFEKSIKKRYVRAKISETIQARDLQLAQMFPDQLDFLKTTPPPIPEVDY